MSKYLFLIHLAHNSEIFLENWKANPTLDSSIPISVARGVLGSSYRGSRAKDQLSNGQSHNCISLTECCVASEATEQSRHVSREIILISTA